MVALWDGDPRKIFDDIDDYATCLERIQNRGGRGFQGFQEKMVSMIIYYLMDEELIGEFVFPLPVDFHVMRVTSACELVRYENVSPDGNVLSPRTLNIVREIYFDYATTHSVNPLWLCDAVWLLSGSLCRAQPGNMTVEPRVGDTEAADQLCSSTPKPTHLTCGSSEPSHRPAGNVPCVTNVSTTSHRANTTSAEQCAYCVLATMIFRHHPCKRHCLAKWRLAKFTSEHYNNAGIYWGLAKR